MLRIFKRKSDDNGIMSLNRSMSKLDRDIYLIQQWIGHLHGRNEEIRDSHDRHVELTRQDIQLLKKWVQYLHAHNVEMHKFVREAADSMEEMRGEQDRIIKRLETIEKGQVRTSERTFEGQIRDNLPQKTVQKVQYEEPIAIIEKKPIMKNEFSGSETELINVLYHADRPLSYGDIAKIVGKKPKSIRNLIYELRDKGVKIISRPAGVRLKGFYLEKEEKIRISGR